MSLTYTGRWICCVHNVYSYIHWMSTRTNIEIDQFNVFDLIMVFNITDSSRRKSNSGCHNSGNFSWTI
jgi:hypothetical protein